MSFSRGDRLIYDNIDLSIPRGKITCIMGPSGTGKTTLLKLIGGLEQPSHGEIYVDGVKINGARRKVMFQIRKKLGMLFQSGALFTDMSVYENVALPLRVHTKLSEQLIRDIILMKLQAVGLRGAIDMMPVELSGGMARRVALARTMALDPDLIMYDEPFTGLDPISMGVIVQLLRLLNDALALTSVFVSHDVQESLTIADYICIISDGKVAGFGTPEELLSKGSPLVKQFLRGLPDGPVPFHYPAGDYYSELLSSMGKNEINRKIKT